MSDTPQDRPGLLDEARKAANTYMQLRDAYVHGQRVETGDPQRPELYGEGLQDEADHLHKVAQLELSAAEVQALHDLGEGINAAMVELAKIVAEVAPQIVAAFASLAEAVNTIAQEHPELVEKARKQRGSGPYLDPDPYGYRPYGSDPYRGRR